MGSNFKPLKEKGYDKFYALFARRIAAASCTAWMILA
jgi:hypothetical protein